MLIIGLFSRPELSSNWDILNRRDSFPLYWRFPGKC